MGEVEQVKMLPPDRREACEEHSYHDEAGHDSSEDQGSSPDSETRSAAGPDLMVEIGRIQDREDVSESISVAVV